ncbi:MAG TPA: SUMF1/EgtB/PvdO family nonheme iron enzyme [Polyangiaceae bacterium]|nr:SUMF1/EgtB/PvdO family nonheme iron enzyme [Polyangiaceae bacterium]
MRLLLASLLLLACKEQEPSGEEPTATATVSASAPTATATPTASASAPVPRPIPFPGAQALDQEQLFALLPKGDAEQEKVFRRFINVGGPGKMNQGNPELAGHEVSRGACWRGLEGVTLQTPEQRRICGGHEYMVPIHDGDPKKAKACIDIFEFPNRPCELPFVWTPPTPAREVCRALGKRLCTQSEWVRACSADPKGGEPSRYAYGEKLDLTICNTNKPHAKFNKKGGCNPHSIKTAWDTCSTNTEPSGSFPRCRSRLGVFDQHGNVAEAMTRREDDDKIVTQLKGSAFFYVDVHVPDGEPSKRTTYSDHCAHNPRWHVEPIERAWHVNYHLGFRCCYSVEKH